MDIETSRPAFRGPFAIWRRFAHWVGLRNTETRESVVRRYVVLKAGQPCTEFRRAESERLLRAQPFIASASVRAVPHGPDSARIVVETVDEVPALFGARYRADDWLVLAGNENLWGTGTRVLLRAEQREAYRNGYGAEIEHRQIFGRPYILRAQAVQYPVGERWLFDLGHPFITDLQRIAWHAGASHRMEYVALRSEQDDATLTLPTRQTAWDIGGGVRMGPPGRTFLTGGLLTGERITPSAATRLITDSGFVDASGEEALVARRFSKADVIRANFVSGFRNIRYVPARGFDALTAQQDLANGTQFSLIVGKSLPSISEDDDAFFAAEAFAGRGGPGSYLGVQIDGEARRPLRDTANVSWDGILASGRAAWYLKPSSRVTSIVSVEGAGGWRERFPFLLELGDFQGGVRGFGGADVSGGRRVVARIEERYIVGPVRNRGDLGFAAFAETGKVWAGDAPFGQTSPVATSVGISVLATIPRGGQRLYRMDIAFPLRGPDKGIEFRFGGRDHTRHFWETPDDVMRARSAAIPRRIFEWP